jgi:hypothetical protein
MTTSNTAPKAPEAPEAPKPPGPESLISFPAIIVAALVAATTALIRPYLETSTESTVLIAVFLSVTTTTSKSIYTACVGKITKDFRGRRWKSILLAGLLAGLVACFVGIGSVTGAEVAMGKEPSIVAPLPDPSSDPVAAPLSPPSSDPDHPILDYYEDVDHDGLGTGKSEQHQLGEQRPGWVDNNRDQCPLQPGPPRNAGCPAPNYYEDVDHDLLGAGPPHPQGLQLPGWVDNAIDQCPQQPGPSTNAGCPDNSAGSSSGSRASGGTSNSLSPRPIGGTTSDDSDAVPHP